jgi:hypothetical protein
MGRRLVLDLGADCMGLATSLGLRQRLGRLGLLTSTARAFNCDMQEARFNGPGFLFQRGCRHCAVTAKAMCRTWPIASERHSFHSRPVSGTAEVMDARALRDYLD